jgi:molybdate transport system substrate-binding protein
MARERGHCWRETMRLVVQVWSRDFDGRSLMKLKSIVRWLALSAAAVLLTASAASAADIKVMISAGFFHVYSELLPAFERTTGHHVLTTRGPSMGESPEAIPTRLTRGEAADVVIMDGGETEELGKRGLLRAASKIDLARSLIGMVVRAGAEKPDISSVEALKKTLLKAKSIAYSDSGSGTYLSTTLFPKLGVTNAIAGKVQKVRGPPSGEPVAAVVARGEAEIGFQQVAELIHVPGITFVGTIPAEVQPPTFFSGALTDKVQQPEAAVALLRFLSSADAAPVITKAGLIPMATR